MTCAEFWSLIIQAIGVVGTLLVVVLAIWGGGIRSRLAGPKLSLRLLNSQGTLNFLTDGTPARYYILKISNQRRWAQAKNVRVILTKILKPDSSGTFVEKVFSGPLQLTWRFPQNRPQYSILGPDDFCTFGNLIKGQQFVLSPYIIPNNFVGFINPSEQMRFEVITVADSAESNTLCIEISWDGNWSDDGSQMQSHLVVREVNVKTGCLPFAATDRRTASR
jgi:hypothetical protein